MQSDEKKIWCFNRGCGSLFSIDDNKEDCCRHHVGQPYFHDGYKGWTCCGKRSTNFTEFLNIQGCTLSKHNPIKPAEPSSCSIKLDDLEVDISPVKPVAKSQPSKRPPANVPMENLKTIVLPAVVEEIENLKKRLAFLAESTFETSIVPDKTPCKNNGCKVEYAEGKDLGACFYHPGTPIFHECLKYWSCCRKPSSDFSKFLEQPGCAEAKHLWFRKKESVVNCRYDWLQTSEYTTIVIYAKNYDSEKSRIAANNIRLLVRLYFPEQEYYFEKMFDLFGIINLEKSCVTMSPTKIEIKLKKCSTDYWTTLEYKEKE